VILRNREVTPGTLAFSRSGTMFLVLEVRRLDRFHVGMSYTMQVPGCESAFHYTEEKRSAVFLSDAVYVRTGDGQVTTA
jgi:hypothetical protein